MTGKRSQVSIGDKVGIILYLWDGQFGMRCKRVFRILERRGNIFVLKDVKSGETVESKRSEFVKLEKEK